MNLSKKQKVAVYFIAAIALGLVAVVIIINLIIGNIIENKIKNSLSSKERINYIIELRNVNANILTGNINLKDLKITPDSSFIEKLINGESDQSTAVYAMIPTFRLAGIGLYKALTSKNIDIRKILFKKAELKIYLGKNPKNKTEAGDKKMNADSIFIKGLNGIDIGSIEFSKCKLEVFDLVNDIQIMQSEDLELEIDGIQLKELEGLNNYFKIDVDLLNVEILKERINMPNGNYYMTFDRLYLNLADSLVELEGFVYKPTYEDKYELTKKLEYTSEIFDVTLKKLCIRGIDFRRIKSEGLLYANSILAQDLDLKILMDKRLPFNEGKRPKLPHQALKHMRLPLYINKIDIKNSKLIYQEKYEGSEELMTAILADLNIQIHFVTSIKDSINTGKSMTVILNSNFMEKTPLSVNFDFPLYHKADTFYFSGHLASAKMSEFNKASSPAMGVKFTSGDLKEIDFSGSANDRYSKGNMTMLYSNLEAEVAKKDTEKDKNKFLSWVANTVVHASNPGSNNKLRTATMEFERVPYKGFGNFVWKTLQSGIVATVTPTGKKVRTTKEDQNSDSVKSKTEEKISKKEGRKKAKEEKKKDKN